MSVSYTHLLRVLEAFNNIVFYLCLYAFNAKREVLKLENNLHNRTINVDIEDEIKKSFISYAMAVNISRALPDVRDGLKPVHRRILLSLIHI